MRHIRMTFALAVGALFAWSVPGIAAEPASSAQGPSAQKIFERLDKNNDGKLVKDEVGEERMRLFERLLKRGDQNHDGLLSRNEFLKATKERQRPVSREGDRREGDRREGNRGRGRPNPDQFFQRFDKNNDGKLTLQEFPERLRERAQSVFKKLGKDSITKAEFVKLHKRGGQKGQRGGQKGQRGGEKGRRGGHLFQKFDKNKDGKLTLQEFPEKLRERVRPMFKRLGKDFMTKEDFAKLHKQRGQKGQRGGQKGGRDGKGKRGRAGGQGKGHNVGQIVARIFSQADTNGDGKISKNEAPSRMKEHFNNIDANGDGAIDKNELKKQFEKRFKNRDGSKRKPGQNRKKRKQRRQK